ncbi:MAG: hypothetical protein NZM37_04705 [Sandaracinaceae bacterium]|nr:hypothetical protein [Sandaracinaceae bacterium]
MRVFRALLWLWMLVFCLWTPQAKAGGFELSGVGTRGLGRGGAFTARVDDPLALAINPSALSEIESQILLNATLVIWDACVTRSGNYAAPGVPPEETYAGGASIFGPSDGPDQPSLWADRPFHTVCNQGFPQIVPQLGLNLRLTRDLGLGAGIIAPNGTGTARFGGDDGTITAEGRKFPTPVRYAMTSQDLLLFFPSVGVGYRPIDWLRVGLTLQWGVAIINYVNYVSSGASASGIPPTPGFEDPSADIRSRLSVVDPFVPAGILSIHLVPIDAMDVVLWGRLSDAVGGFVPAEGTLELTTGAYGTGSETSFVPNTTKIGGTTLHAGQPFLFGLALRLADRTRPRTHQRTLGEALAKRIEDALVEERFDIELDVVYEHLRQVTDFVVTPPPGSQVVLKPGGGAAPLSVPVPTPLPIPHGWSDVLTFRLGGDVNAISGLLALRSGVSFELPLDTSFRHYLQNDFIGGWRLGLHTGATLRLERFDVSIAYAFFLAETINVEPRDARFRRINALDQKGVCMDGTTYDPNRPVTSRGCYPAGYGEVVNAGRYEQNFHLVSLGVTYHF